MKSLIDSFFSPKLEFFPSNIDMHSHLLPGIDDGANTLEQSIELIQELIKMGYSHFICTPHIMGDHFKNTKETIEASYKLLINELIAQKIDVKVEYAAEYYIDEIFTKNVENGHPFLCLKDKYLLVETSYINAPKNFREIVFQLQIQGYTVVLAHPERYSYLFNDFEQYKKIYDLGILFQINLNSLCGYYSPMSRKIAQKLIDLDMVDFIGTDCHHVKHVHALQKTLNERYTKKLFTKKLLNNQLA